MLLKKNSAVEIILPAFPTPRELFAAEELFRYLQTALGIVRASSAETDCVRFFIGGPSRNSASAELIGTEEFNSLLTGEEGLLIRIRGNCVLLAGSDGYEDQQRGTVYAVYEFLEQFVGCTLAAYSAPEADAGEIVPQLEELNLPDGQRCKPQADRPFRGAVIQYGDRAGNPKHGLNIAFLDWLIKNRFNRVVTWCKIYDGWKAMGLLPEFEKRGIIITVSHHDAIPKWLPFYGNEEFPEPYYETHPEYYRLCADGSRFTPPAPDDPYGQWVLCSRNTDCIEQVSKNLIKWISENPQVDRVGFLPMDGTYEQCCCEKCKPYTKVENYAYFQNEVANRVTAALPLSKLCMSIYTDLWTCPENQTLSPALFCYLATWANCGLRTCGKPDGSSLIGTDYDTTLLEWKAKGANVAFYDYYMGVYSCRQKWIPMADEIQSIWKYFAEKDIDGSMTQIECFHIWNHLANMYTFGRTAYDSSLSLKDNLQELCKLFGEGAPYIIEAILHGEQVLDGQTPILNAPNYLVAHMDKAFLYDCYEKALAAASSPRCRNNIRLMRMVLRYSDLEVNDALSQNHRPYDWLFDYEDPTGELAYMAVNYDSFLRNETGYGIAIPVKNSDTKNFQPDHWYQFE